MLRKDNFTAVFRYLIQLLLIVIFCTSMLEAAIRVINRIDNATAELDVLDPNLANYVSARDISLVFSKRQPFVNEERMKMVLYFTDSRIKISGNSSYVVVDNVVYHMPTHTRAFNNDLYVPTSAFFDILKQTVLPRLNYDSGEMRVDIDLIEFNITNLEIDQKANGTILTIYTNEQFNDGNISSFIHDNGWFYLTVQNGILDTIRINKADTRGVVSKVTANQFSESAQMAFRLRSKIIGHEVFQSHDPNAIIVTLRTPLDKSAERVKALRSRWQLDTVVLDAGHGGKDSGTVGRKGTKEKDIVLDITKHLGLLLQKKTNIQVIYTREEDIFVPLWQRTQKANESNGKIFVSIHCNSNPKRSARGFETYLLRPGKSDDAIEIASRENEVIKMEVHSGEKYKGLTGENLIMATMAQSMYMKESEELAALTQDELAKRLDSPNRGVKQAGFVVLIGASMPNVLIETGFLSNPTEEIRLRNTAYRQKIAEGIFYAIIQFRTLKEEMLAEG